MIAKTSRKHPKIYRLKNYISILIVSLVCLQIQAQEKKIFFNLQEVLSYVKTKNNTFQNATIQTKLAELTYKSSIGNVINPRIPTSAQLLDNTKQQVSYLPAEAFGGPAGTFKEAKIGLQYVSTFSLQPQFDILNLANIAQIKSAKINLELNDNQNKINEKKIYDQLNAIYFNILSYEAQQEIIYDHIEIAQKLLQVTKNKFTEGIARKQEVNEAEVNLISLQDKLQQLEFNLQMQYQSFALFFENTVDADIRQSVWDFEKTNEPLQTNTKLLTQNNMLQLKMAQQDLRVARYQNVPVISFTSSINWQNLSNSGLFHKDSRWTDYNFVGVKLNWDLPTNIQKLTTSKNKAYQIDILKNNVLHSDLENQNANLQMGIEYQKALNQLSNMKKIYELKKDTYEKNYNQYIENILALDKLLISQNDLLASRINLITSLANIGFNKNKIEINNEF